MGNSQHQTSSPWSRFVAVERRKRRRQNLANCCRQTTAFLFSHVGLSAMIVAYTVMGGFLFKALEGPFEKEEKNRVAEMKARTIGEILQAADSMGCFQVDSRSQFARSLRDSNQSRVDGNIRNQVEDEFTTKLNNETLLRNDDSYDIFSNRRSKDLKNSNLHRSSRHQMQIKSIQNRNTFNVTLNIKFTAFAREILRAIKDSGWNGQDDSEEGSEQWSHAGAILYAITVITTIGYGHIAPKTDWGRIVTIIYALIGIPLTFLYLSNIGNFLADCFRIFYKRVCCDVLCCKKCERQRKRERLKLRKQRVNAIQRGLVLKAAMHTLMVDCGRPANRQYDRLRSMVGIPLEKIESTKDNVLQNWVAGNNRRAFSCEKGDCVGVQHFPVESADFSPIYRKAFHSDSSLTSLGDGNSKRHPRKRVHRTNFKGVTIMEPNSLVRKPSTEWLSNRNLASSRFSHEPLMKSMKSFECAPPISGCSHRRAKSSKGIFGTNNLLRIRKDSIFQSDSLLISNKPSVTENDSSKPLKSYNKAGKLRKSLSVRFFHKQERFRVQNSCSDFSKRKPRFPSKQFFRQKSTQKSSDSKPPSDDRNFFNWQKRRRKETDDVKAKENWQKLIAYSRQLSEENERLTKSQPNYNSLPLKAESLLKNRHARDETVNQTHSTYKVDDSKALAVHGGATNQSCQGRESTSKFKWSIPNRSIISKYSTSRTKGSQNVKIPAISCSTKRKSRRLPNKNSSDKSSAADQIGADVRHNDSKNSIESFVTAICQSLSSIGEEEVTVARSTNAARPKSSSKRSNSRPHGETRRPLKKGKESGADSRRKHYDDSSKKRKIFHKEKFNNKIHKQTPAGTSNSELPSATFRSNVDQNETFLGNCYSSPCALQETEEDDLEEDDDCSKVTVPIYICLILISGYLFAGSALFSFWEGWNTITGSYFCFITLSTIGFGDIVPGTGVNDWASQAKLVLCTLWLALGLSLLAMCFNLMQEEVKERCRRLGMKLGLLKDESKPIYE